MDDVCFYVHRKEGDVAIGGDAVPLREAIDLALGHGRNLRLVGVKGREAFMQLAIACSLADCVDELARGMTCRAGEHFVA